MRNSVSVLLIVLCVSMMSFSKIFAAEQGNYVPGVEGIKAASLPPPGFYWRQYYAFYNASTLADQNGDELPVGFDLGVMAVVERFIYVTKKKFLGADYAFDIIVPLQHINLEIDAMGIDDNKFSLGDICIEPFLLSWHGDRYDAACGVGFYAPTGAYDITEPASPGKDHWSTLLTLGTTLYLD
ncbi:MAG: transporter, partial [Gemmatimonadota bacterium]|nr:transporter [Gemmatimonadota bacterium]